MPHNRLIPFLCCILFLVGTQIGAAKKTFKISSQAPERSIWGKALIKIAQNVSAVTDGEVEFKIFHGGVQGDEQTVLRKMRVKQLHGAGFIGQGLSIINPDALALTLPALFESQEEFEYVLNEVGPEISQACAKKGYKVLSYPQLGYAFAFSRDPIHSIDDLKSSKPWLIQGDVMSSELFDVLDVSPVSASVGEVLPALNSGMIRLVFSPPTAVIAMQWHDKLSFRLSREIIPTMGVLLVDLERWNTLPRKTQKKVEQIVNLEIARLNKAVLKTNDKAIEVLEHRGMETIQVNDELAQIVVDASEQVAQRLADKAFSKSFLERLLKAAADYREKNDGK